MIALFVGVVIQTALSVKNTTHAPATRYQASLTTIHKQSTTTSSQIKIISCRINTLAYRNLNSQSPLSKPSPTNLTQIAIACGRKLLAGQVFAYARTLARIRKACPKSARPSWLANPSGETRCINGADTVSPGNQDQRG